MKGKGCPGGNRLGTPRLRQREGFLSGHSIRRRKELSSYTAGKKRAGKSPLRLQSWADNMFNLLEKLHIEIRAPL
jgi:hypothetical protein